jgi:hypothetical protein
MRSVVARLSLLSHQMKSFFFHPLTLIITAYVLLISAWFVITTVAVRHRAESIPVKQNEQIVNHQK